MRTYLILSLLLLALTGQAQIRIYPAGTQFAISDAENTFVRFATSADVQVVFYNNSVSVAVRGEQTRTLAYKQFLNQNGTHYGLSLTEAIQNWRLVVGSLSTVTSSDFASVIDAVNGINLRKVDTYEVNTIAEAKTLAVPGKSTDFIIRNHPPYGQTRAFWNGSYFSISPLITITVP